MASTCIPFRSFDLTEDDDDDITRLHSMDLQSLHQTPQFSHFYDLIQNIDGGEKKLSNYQEVDILLNRWAGTIDGEDEPTTFSKS